MPEQNQSTGELGDELGCQAWKIARVFELGLVDEPPRVAGRRMIPRSMVPQIVNAMEDKGWLPKQPRDCASRESSQS